MGRALVISLLYFLSLGISEAQNTMRIYYKDGKEQDIQISQIDYVSFVAKEAPEEDVSMVGSWLWGNRERGYYELLTFNEDNSYIGYDNYFVSGFDAYTYGFYFQYGNMLTLQSNGFGYQHRYNWFVTTLTENALAVMTKMGSFIYYKLKPMEIHITMPETYSDFTDGYTIVFTDGVVVSNEDNVLRGITKGTTHILVKKNLEDRIYAYKVVVE